MAALNINGFQLLPSELKGVRMYVQICHKKVYKNLRDFEVDRAKTIIRFMQSIYLTEHPFDELDELAQILTESTNVATLLFPKTDTLRQTVEVLINFNNMLAVNSDNYKKYLSHSLALNDSQKMLLASKTKAVTKAFEHLQLSNNCEKKTLKLLREIDTINEITNKLSYQIERRKHYKIESVEYVGEAKKVMLYRITIKGG